MTTLGRAWAWAKLVAQAVAVLEAVAALAAAAGK